MSTLAVIGGASIGWVSASWPFAKLAASPRSLKLTGLLGSYELSPREVVSLEPSGSIPFFSSGIRIVHTRADYPKRMLFFSFRNPRALVEKIRASGFIPTGQTAALSSSSTGFPVRWTALLLLIALWNLLLFADQQLPGTDPHHPGPLALLALVLAFVISWLALRSEWVQSLLMREGQSVGRIKPFLLPLQLITGVMVVIFMVTYIFDHVAG